MLKIGVKCNKNKCKKINLYKKQRKKEREKKKKREKKCKKM